MRHFALTFAGALLAAAVALLAYHFLIGGKRQAQLAGEVAELAQGQQQIRKALDQTQETLSTVSDRQSELIREDLQAIAGMRVAIAEYYQTNARMPANQAEMGLPPPEQYRGKSLKSATLQPGGVIELVFDAASGVDGGRIRFVADASHVEAMGVRWRCETSDYPHIRRVSVACEYLAPANQNLSAPAPQS
jgi:hypothetical protein